MKKVNVFTFISNCKTINLLLIIACAVLFNACRDFGVLQELILLKMILTITGGCIKIDLCAR